MTTELDALIADLSNVVGRHPDVTGAEFMAACERVAAGYFDDLPAFDLDAFISAFRQALNRD